VVHCDAFTFQHQADPMVAKPAALPRNRTHLDANVLIINLMNTTFGLRTENAQKLVRVTNFTIKADQATCEGLSDGKTFYRFDRRRPSVMGHRHGFPKRSFNTTLSNTVSANNILSREFSYPSAFNRRASETSKPAYLAFHL
jgi:hypothetical protein